MPLITTSTCFFTSWVKFQHQIWSIINLLFERGRMGFDVHRCLTVVAWRWSWSQRRWIRRAQEAAALVYCRSRCRRAALETVAAPDPRGRWTEKPSRRAGHFPWFRWWARSRAGWIYFYLNRWISMKINKYQITWMNLFLFKQIK